MADPNIYNDMSDTNIGPFTLTEALDYEEMLDRNPTSNNRPTWYDAKTGKRVSIGRTGSSDNSTKPKGKSKFHK